MSGENRPVTEREVPRCAEVVASGPAGLLHAVCGHLLPCGEHGRGSLGRDNQWAGDRAPVACQPPTLAELWRHAAARRVLRNPSSTDTEREEARSILGLSTPPNGRDEQP